MHINLHFFLKQRQLEIYHLTPNTSYEFRIWANNQLGSGDKVTISGTTSPKIEEKGNQPNEFPSNS